MITQPLVNILIVNWNGHHHLEAGIPSLLNTNYPNYKIIILDNGSIDGSQKWIQSNYPQIKLVQLDRNYGFAVANNIGINLSLSNDVDYIALLNNDTRVEPDWLTALMGAIKQDTKIALCQARQYTWDGSQKILFSFVPEWADSIFSFHPIDLSETTTLTPFVSGCAMVIRSAALKEIGCFDERYFMYVEDVDLTLRAWTAGWKCIDVPSAIVYHRFSGSSPSATWQSYLGYRNQLATILKIYQPSTLKQFIKPILRRWFLTTNKIIVRAVWANLKMLPSTLKQRKKVQSLRKQNDQSFLELVKPFM